MSRRLVCLFPAVPQDRQLPTIRRFSERAIHDATQVCAYFNYINRIADALGVEHEDFIDEVGRPHRPDE